MKICVNLHPFLEDGGGTRYFVQSLLETLSESRYSEKISYDLICSEANEILVNNLFSNKKGLKILKNNDLNTIHYQKYNLYFSPLNNLDPYPNIKKVSCIMDIQDQVMPEYFSEGELNARKIVYPRICREADIVCTISEYCKKTFVEYFKTDPKKIKVIPLAPQRKILYSNSICLKNLVCNNFILYPSSFYRHKNHIELINGFIQASNLGLDTKLVLVGNGLDNIDVLNLISKNNKIIHIENCHPGAMKWLYENCKCLIIPTRFEGFSMPLAEGIHFNCNIACNDLEVLREVGKCSAVYLKLNTRKEICSFLLNADSYFPIPISNAEHLLTWDDIADMYTKIFMNL